MVASRYEIEIKTLLGGKEKADALLTKMQASDPETKLIGESSQLNHYFVVGDRARIIELVSEQLSSEKRDLLKKMLEEGKNISLRTREAKAKVLLVVKASIDDTTSSNGTARLEFEEALPGMTLAELDQLLLAAGCTYQAKWSRDRKEYAFRDSVVCIDRNAGYGYLAEFEKILEDQGQAEQAKGELRALMAELGVVELPQDRLERMFAFYNEHWPEYYGTDKIFDIQ